MTAIIVFLVPILMIQPAAADGPNKNETDLELEAADGWPIRATFIDTRAARSKETPIIVLLTPANGDGRVTVTRRVWTDLARKLSARGFAVLSVDLRKHGDSLPEGLSSKQKTVRARDYVNMVQGDMEAVKAFLMEKHHAKQLNVRKLGIAAVGASCSVAAAFAVVDWNRPPWPDGGPGGGTPRGQDVRSLLLISPQSAKGLKASQSLKILSPPAYGIGIRIYHSDKDKAEQETAEKLYKIVALKGEEFAEVRSLVPGPASGEEFLKGSVGERMNEEVVEFFETTVKDLQEPWQDRKSKLDD